MCRTPHPTPWGTTPHSASWVDPRAGWCRYAHLLLHGWGRVTELLRCCIAPILFPYRWTFSSSVVVAGDNQRGRPAQQRRDGHARTRGQGPPPPVAHTGGRLCWHCLLPATFACDGLVFFWFHTCCWHHLFMATDSSVHFPAAAHSVSAHACAPTALRTRTAPSLAARATSGRAAPPQTTATPRRLNERYVWWVPCAPPPPFPHDYPTYRFLGLRWTFVCYIAVPRCPACGPSHLWLIPRGFATPPPHPFVCRPVAMELHTVTTAPHLAPFTHCVRWIYCVYPSGYPYVCRADGVPPHSRSGCSCHIVTLPAPSPFVMQTLHTTSPITTGVPDLHTFTHITFPCHTRYTPRSGYTFYTHTHTRFPLCIYLPAVCLLQLFPEVPHTAIPHPPLYY